MLVRLIKDVFDFESRIGLYPEIAWLCSSDTTPTGDFYIKMPNRTIEVQWPLRNLMDDEEAPAVLLVASLNLATVELLPNRMTSDIQSLESLLHSDQWEIRSIEGVDGDHRHQQDPLASVLEYLWLRSELGDEPMIRFAVLVNAEFQVYAGIQLIWGSSVPVDMDSRASTLIAKHLLPPFQREAASCQVPVLHLVARDEAAIGRVAQFGANIVNPILQILTNAFIDQELFERGTSYPLAFRTVFRNEGFGLRSRADCHCTICRGTVPESRN